MIDCPYCGKLTDPNLGSCPHCGGTLESRQAAPKRKSASKGRQTCPGCRALVQDGDIICVACGTNLLTGQRVVRDREVEEIRQGFHATPRMIYGGAGAAVVVLALAVVVFVLTRDPRAQAMRLAAEGSYIRAEEVLAEYVKGAPRDAAARFDLGKLQFRNNRFSTAASTFEQTARLDPANIEAGWWGVASLVKAGDEDVNRQIALLDRITDADPGDSRAWYLLSLLNGVAGDIDRQMASLDEFNSAGGDVSAYYWNRGLILAAEGELDSARSAFLGVAATGREADAAAALGMIALLQGDDAGAMDKLTEAVETPGLTIRWEVLSELGKLNVAAGDFTRAAEVLDETLKLNSTNSAARYLRGVAKSALGKQQEALQDFEYLTGANRGYAQESGVEAARIHLLRGDTGRATTLLARAARVGEPGKAYYLLQGRVALVENDLRSAMTMFGRALAIDPDYAAAYLERGLLQVRRDRLEEGIGDLQAYLRQLGTDVKGTRATDIRRLVGQLRRTVETARAEAVPRRELV